ncbi:MAG: glycosyltransferase family 4 protein [Phototrophicaceae bacterium]
MTQRLIYNVNIPRFFVSHRLPLALAARDAGYDVHITTSDGDLEQIEVIKATGLPFHPLPLAQHGTNPLTELQTIRAMVTLYKTLQPDIIHHVSIKPVIYGGIAARIARVPAVVSAMSGLGRVFSDSTLKATMLQQVVRPLFKIALGHPNTAMIFQNPDDQKTFVQMGLIQSANTTLIRGSGVDMAVFKPTPEADGKPIVLFAGRLMWKKGIGDFVAAARQLHDQARFVVVGYAESSSPDAVPLTRIQTWADEGVIEWWGKRDDMPAVFAQSHIVCLPSSYGEGVPKVLIEAAASGRAIVTTDTAGCREITHDGENGTLFPANDIEALIAALQRLINQPELRQQMGQHGREIAQEHFSLDDVTAQTLALYERLLTDLTQDVQIEPLS